MKMPPGCCHVSRGVAVMMECNSCKDTGQESPSRRRLARLTTRATPPPHGSAARASKSRRSGCAPPWPRLGELTTEEGRERRVRAIGAVHEARLAPPPSSSVSMKRRPPPLPPPPPPRSSEKRPPRPPLPTPAAVPPPGGAGSAGNAFGRTRRAGSGVLPVRWFHGDEPEGAPVAPPATPAPRWTAAASPRAMMMRVPRHAATTSAAAAAAAAGRRERRGGGSTAASRSSRRGAGAGRPPVVVLVREPPEVRRPTGEAARAASEERRPMPPRPWSAPVAPC